MKLFVILFAVLAVVAANPGWGHHEVSSGWQSGGGWSGGHGGGWNSGWEPQYHHHHHHQEHIHQPEGIPNPHPKPLLLKGHDHVNRIHLDHAHIPHPHLIGVEHEVHVSEPVVKKIHGHGW